MCLIQEAYLRLFPEKTFDYEAELNYNLRLSDFNANIRLDQRKADRKIIVNLNLQWKDIDEEIKIGLIQSLLLKLFKSHQSTPNTELYANFVRNIPLLTPKRQNDPLLQDSFDRMNALFFENQLEQANLCWGTASRSKLGSYNFHEDLISISTLFQNASPELLDYVMYHEMLHKEKKFSSKNGRNSYHSRDFREAERRFPQKGQVEKEIMSLVRKNSSPTSWWAWWRS